jgi:ABC-type transporter Mla subunit MlaD
VRRLASIGLLIAAAAVAAAILSASASGSSTASFDVIFDDARGLISGQLVKVAGAQAGTIKNVVVIKQGSGSTTSYKAKIEATIESQFMPLRANATCSIRPQALIGEDYVECEPGSPPAPVLKGLAGQPPTVPVENTSEPVNLLDLFNIFNLPTRERLAMLVNELGIGTAGEGQNFNAILYRANPSLKLAQQVIGILARQKAQLQTVVDATNTIAQQAASHTGDVQSFIDRASTLTTTIAEHRSSLAAAINRLPALLRQAQPALDQLDVVARDGTPLVQQLGATAPDLNRVSADLGPFVKQAKPGLAKLSTALKHAIPAIKHTLPLVKTVRSYLKRSLGKTELAGRLFTSLQQAGFSESFLGIVYYVTSDLSRFDSTSHLGDLGFFVPGDGNCNVYSTTPVAGCQANYSAAQSLANFLLK